MKPLVLVACEYSGRVRDAFAAMGCEAWSCDFLPTESPGNHIQGDALEAMVSRQWDLIVAHPPCTYLCNSGVRWLAPGGRLNKERHKLMMEGAALFSDLYHSQAKRVCIENPVMHGHARRHLEEWHGVPAFTQSIQPWQHGEPFQKRTCLWLRGLPLLNPTCILKERKQECWLASPGKDRWKLRSRTYLGIAKSMASAWAPILLGGES